MLLFFLAVIAGLGLLVWSADRFVYGASATASGLGIPPIIIGLAVVGVGTSAPEMLVSAMAAAGGNPGLAVGNAIGSNIANVGLVVGATALIMPMTMRSETLRREFPAMLLVMVMVFVLVLDRELGRYDGIILMVATGVMLLWVIHLGVGARRGDPLGEEFEVEIPSSLTMSRALLNLIAGLVLLLISSRVIVWGAVNIAQVLGVSDLLIGLTIVAVGTSLPELAASVMSAVKGEPDIAIGNIIGSNMFNLLPVLALPGLIHPFQLPAAVNYRDYPIMFGLTLALFAMAYGLRRPARVTRVHGGILLACFFGYQALLYFTKG